MKIKPCHEKLNKCVQQFKLAPVINEFIIKMKNNCKKDSKGITLQQVRYWREKLFQFCKLNYDWFEF
jgi:hypothetical protein